LALTGFEPPTFRFAGERLAGGQTPYHAKPSLQQAKLAAIQACSKPSLQQAKLEASQACSKPSLHQAKLAG